MVKQKKHYQAICLIGLAMLTGCAQWTQGYYQQTSIDQATQHIDHIQQSMPTLSQPSHFYICGDQTSVVPCMPKTLLKYGEI